MFLVSFYSELDIIVTYMRVLAHLCASTRAPCGPTIYVAAPQRLGPGAATAHQQPHETKRLGSPLVYAINVLRLRSLWSPHSLRLGGRAQRLGNPSGGKGRPRPHTLHKPFGFIGAGNSADEPTRGSRAGRVGNALRVELLASAGFPSELRERGR